MKLSSAAVLENSFSMLLSALEKDAVDKERAIKIVQRVIRYFNITPPFEGFTPLFWAGWFTIYNLYNQILILSIKLYYFK